MDRIAVYLHSSAQVINSREKQNKLKHLLKLILNMRPTTQPTSLDKTITIITDQLLQIK